MHTIALLAQVTPDSNVLASQITASAVIVWLMQQLKNAKWFPAITHQTGRLNRIVAVILAAGAAIGIHATFDQAAGTLMITGLTATGLAHGAWMWLKSFALQEIIYQGAVNKPNVVGTGK